MKRKLSGNYSSGSESTSSQRRGNASDNSATTATTTSPPPSDDDSSSKALAIVGSNKPARRGHFKSRLGCLNCKRRRVKCNEQRPTCSPCQRLGLECDYATTPAAAGPPRGLSTSLSLEDLHFYHRFLNTAFPSLPLRSDNVWKQCGAMSYQSECLAHAALGLGAQHLTVHGTADYTKQALHHRAGAIRLMNEQFAKPPKDGEHCDALFGAIMCLVTQTTLLPDGMTEYMILTRAGALVWAFYLPGHAGSLFHSWTHESHFAAIMSIVSDEPKDFSLVDQFHASVMKLKPLCDRKPVESYYFRHLIAAVEAIHVSSLKAWASHASLWRAHCMFSNNDFHAFLDHKNHLAQLLMVHMLMTDYLMGPFCVPNTETSKFPARRTAIVSWARNAIRRLPPEFKEYGTFLDGFCTTVENGDGRYLLTP